MASYFAAIDSDGMDLAVWGVGTTASAAESDAEKQEGFERTANFKIVALARAEYREIKARGGGRRPEITSRPSPHGGARPGAGAPRTTGSADGPPIAFRLSADQRARAEAMARAQGVAVNALARDALLALLGSPRG